MKTEWEIEKTKDTIRALDPEQKGIAKKVLLEEQGVDLEKLRETICDDCCHWSRVCATQEKLESHCARCRMPGLWDAVFGQAAG